MYVQYIHTVQYPTELKQRIDLQLRYDDVFEVKDEAQDDSYTINVPSCKIKLVKVLYTRSRAQGISSKSL